MIFSIKESYIYIILIVFTFLSSILLNYLLLNYSKVLRKGKIIKNGERWSDTKTPTIGGTTFFIIFLLSIVFYAQFSLILGLDISIKEVIFLTVGASIAYLLGLYDDTFYLNPILKLLIQLLIAFILIFGDIYIKLFNVNFFNYILTAIWIIGIMNATNLLDNMDGTTSIAILGIAVSILVLCIYNNVIENIFLASLLMIIGIILGFLIFNWPKAKIYMGDSGSMLLGYISAIWGIKYIWNLGNLIPNISYHWVVPFILIAVIYCLPIFDTTITFLKRLIYRRSPLLGGKDHTTHHLIYLGLSNSHVLFLMMLISILNIIVSFNFINHIDHLNSFFYLGIFLYLIIIFAFFSVYIIYKC